MERIRRCLNCMESYEDHLDSCPFCHYKEPREWDSKLILKPGFILQERYITGTLRAEGETDLTYIGWDGLFDRKVLIQEFFPTRLASRDASGRVVPLQGAEAEFRKWADEFVRQRENLIRLCESPDVICVFSAFRDNGTAAMTYQYAEVPTLREYLAENGPVRAQLAKAYLDQAVRAVWEVHRNGGIHGNICPDSFWMTSGDRRLVLKDFAEPAHYCGRTDLKDYGKAGTWTDVRGLSLLFASLLAGAPCTDEKAAAGVFAKEKKMLSDLERKTLQEALQAEAGSPISTVEAFAKGILGDRRTEELTLKVREQTKIPARKEIPFRNKLIAAGILAIVLLLAAIAFLFFGRADKQETLPETAPVETSAAPEVPSLEETEHTDVAMQDMVRSGAMESTAETRSGNLSDGVKQTEEEKKEEKKQETKRQSSTKAETERPRRTAAEQETAAAAQTAAVSETEAPPETTAGTEIETLPPAEAGTVTAAEPETPKGPGTAAEPGTPEGPGTAAGPGETAGPGAAGPGAAGPGTAVVNADPPEAGAPALAEPPGETVSDGGNTAPTASAGGPAAVTDMSSNEGEE